jgi:hypothetical protein
MCAEAGFASRQKPALDHPKAVLSGADEEEHHSCPCRDETSGTLLALIRRKPPLACMLLLFTVNVLGIFCC